MESITLTAKDGISLALNHFKTDRDGLVVIICPGFFMSKDSPAFMDLSQDLFRYFDVITIDFRGHCSSGGLFSFTNKEPDDLQVIISYAKTMYKNVVLLGFSLGAASSLIISSKSSDIKAVIAVSPPVSFKTIENRFYKPEAFLTTLKKWEFHKFYTVRLGNIFSRKVNPVDIVEKISPVPVLFIGGTDDPIIFNWHTKALYDKALEPKSIVIFDKGLHAEELYLKFREEFLKTVTDWISALK